MIKYIFSSLLFIFFCLNTLQSQADKSLSDKQAVIQTIKVLFDGIRASDTSALRSVLHPEAHLQSSYTNKEGFPVLSNGSMDAWIASVGSPHKAIYDEKIWSYKVRITDNLATAWTDYTFYVGEKMSHCGVNAFHLVETISGWKISHITDTRRKDNCITEPIDLEKELTTFMNNWHKAAATADEDTFFGSMASDGIYIGTDATEKWQRAEMKVWSKKYFEQKSAWDFTPLERTFYFSEDKTFAWFEESLDTWMGLCRASGVLIQTKVGWKIKYYHLAVTIANNQIEPFLKIATPSSKLKKQ